MNELAILIIVLVFSLLLVLFLQRFFKKSTRETVLIRTGAGGQKVVMDGGLLVIPVLHRVEAINMLTMRLHVSRTGEQSLMTEDRLRVDIDMAFYVRVLPTEQGVLTAGQAIGRNALNAVDLHDLLEGRLVDAIQAIVAQRTMDELHEKRGAFVQAIRAELTADLESNGLLLESASLTQLDQTPFSALKEDNAFNAVGMRRLAEVIAANKKKRAEIEADADISVRKTELARLKQSLSIEGEQKESEIALKHSVELLQTQKNAESEQARHQARMLAENARVEQEKALKLSEINKELALRKQEVDALEAAELSKIESQITISRKRAQENLAQSETEMSRGEIVKAQETVQSLKERLVSQRNHEMAVLDSRKESEAAAIRAKGEREVLLERSSATAQAREREAKSMAIQMKAKAEGRAALISAENEMDERILRAKTDHKRIAALPRIAGKMAKPLEKIDSIRINHISGIGSGAGPGNENGNHPGNPMAQAVDGVLNMAFQLPAIQKLGQSIGVNLDLDEPERTESQIKTESNEK